MKLKHAGSLQVRAALFMALALLLGGPLVQTAHAAATKTALATTCTPTISVSPNPVNGISGYAVSFSDSWRGCDNDEYVVKVFWGDGLSSSYGWLHSTGSGTVNHIYTVCYGCTKTFSVEFQLIDYYANGPQVVQVKWVSAVITYRNG